MLTASAGLLSACAVDKPLAALAAREYDSTGASPFGALSPVTDPSTGLDLLQLPEGFSYSTYGWKGDEMTTGGPTPGAHDGMAVVGQRASDGAWILIRNHELRRGDTIAAGAGVYDGHLYEGGVLDDEDAITLGGGCTRLFYKDGVWLGAEPALGGTYRNCSGGPTPWGSWLSAEEIIFDGREHGGALHGYVFEVPAEGEASARPIVDMGLFRHEAVAVDPRSSTVYLTEDNKAASGLYKFVPHDRSGQLGSLEAGGTLYMLAIEDEPLCDLGDAEEGDRYRAHWVEIADPNALPEVVDVWGATSGKSGPFMQGEAQGAGIFSRLEGAWFQDGALYFADTDGGAAEEGVIWKYVPDADEQGGELIAIFVSRFSEETDAPDNLCLNPRGQLFFCEDGGHMPERVMGVTQDGQVFAFAANNVVLSEADIAAMGRDGVIGAHDYRASEWAGAGFSPDGQTFFVNIQGPGITFAITGPWEKWA